MPAALADLVAHCHRRLELPGFPDYPGALNGLQVENDGQVTRIGAAVDGGLEAFRMAATRGIDFLLVHHGMFWDPPRPLVGRTRQKVQAALAANLAVYAAHLPLDAHPELGNNALLARHLGLEPARTFAPFQGRDIGLIAAAVEDRAALAARLRARFGRVTAIEFGSERPAEVAVLTGGGDSGAGALRAAGVDTLVTGELPQHWFNRAQEERLNLYLCGHYATEVFGVQALAAELAATFGLPWEFLDTGCPL